MCIKPVITFPTYIQSYISTFLYARLAVLRDNCPTDCVTAPGPQLVPRHLYNGSADIQDRAVRTSSETEKFGITAYKEQTCKPSYIGMKYIQGEFYVIIF